MELSDKMIAVRKMQKYIDAHFDGEITLDDVGRASGYSKYHAVRMFKELTGKSPFETIRALRLTKAARILQASDAKVVDAALESGFDSHDGFTRAFKRWFDIAPQRYSRETPAVNWFIHYPIEAYHLLKEGQKTMETETVSKIVTVTTVKRPARKLIFLRVPTAKDYFAACEEVGCEWEGYYNSIPEKMDTAAGGRLPSQLIKPGTGGHAFFVEVPLGYGKPIPKPYEMAELPPCTYLYFQGMKFENEDDFPTAIGILEEAIAAYPFAQYGWKISENAPCLGMGAEAATGARTAVPVEELEL